MVCTIAFGATAQEPSARVLRPLLGKVVDADGNDVAGAKVHLSYSPVGTASDSGNEHQIQTTDNRGRFRFQAQPCTKHLIWAIGTPNDDGYRLATGLHWIAPGRPFELVTDQKSPVSKLTIRGIELWADYAPFQLQLAPGGLAIKGMTVDLDESGSCTLPPLPGGLTTATIIDKYGQPLTEVRIPTRPAFTRRSLLTRQEVPLVVVDPQGKPIAGATIRQRIRGLIQSDNGLTPSRPYRHLWREHGKTDANGRLVATIASRSEVFAEKNWEKFLFTATKQGFNVTHSGANGNKLFFDGKELEKQGGVTELKFTLKKAKPTILRLMRSPEHGLANQQVTLHRDIKIISSEGNSWSNDNLIFNLTTDGDGMLRIPTLTESENYIGVVLGGASSTEFIPQPLRRMSPHRAISLHRLKIIPGTEHRIELHKSATVKLQMLTEHGGPATDPELILISRAHKNNYDVDGWCTAATTDSAGRVVLQIQPGHWSVFARTKSGMSHLQLKLEDNETKQATMTFEKMPSMQGRVIDADGNPIAGAILDCNRSSTSSSGKRDPVLNAIASNMNWRWIGTTTTDKDGKFACHFLDLTGMTYGARFRHNNNQSENFQIVADDSPVTIQVK